MNQITFFFVIAINLVFLSCNGQTQNNKASANSTVSKIEVIDFHSTHRCMSCNAIEANTKYTLETYFASELKNKTITFLVINIDEKKNEKMAEKFEVSSTALFLNVIINGKETQINLTDFAFMNGNNKDTFSKQLKSKYAY